MILYINITDIDLNNTNVYFDYSYEISLEKKISRVLGGIGITFI